MVMLIVGRSLWIGSGSPPSASSSPDSRRPHTDCCHPTGSGWARGVVRVSA